MPLMPSTCAACGGGGDTPSDVNVVNNVQTLDNKIEDTPHVSGDIGSFVLAVRNDGGGNMVSANGDYAPVQVDSNGALIVTTAPAGSFTAQDDTDGQAPVATGLQSVVNRLYAYDGLNWSRVRSGAIPGSVIVDQGTVPWVVSGTVAVTQSTSPWVVSGTVTADTEFPVASVLADADPNPTTTRVGANNLVFNGATWDRVRSGTALGSILVNNPVAANFLATVNQGTSPWVVSGTVAVTQSTSPWVVSGTVTADTELPAASVLADADPNPTTSRIGANNLVFNGTTWDRARSGTALGSTLVNNPVAANFLATVNQGTSPWVVSGTVTADTELPAASVLADADPNPTTSRIGANNLVFNGATWDRARSGTATGSVLVNNPVAANLLATVTQGTSPWVVSGTVTADTELPAASALADADPNPTTSRIGSNNLVYNGATWDRARSGAALGSTLVNNPVAANLLATVTQGTSPWVVSGTVTADTEFPAAAVLADADPNPTTTRVGADQLVFNGTTWDRVRSGTALGSVLVNNPVAANFLATVTQGTSPWVVSGTVTADTELPAASVLADADPNPTTSRIGSNALVFNGATWDRTREATADAMAVTGLQGAANQVYNGATWDRVRSGTATGSVLVNNPTAANLLATVTQGTSPWVVSGTVTADTELPAASSLADADPNPTTSRIGANNLVFNGTTWDRARSGTALGSVLVNNPVAANLLATVNQGTSPWVVSVSNVVQTLSDRLEDTGHVSGDPGNFILGVRNDTQAVLTSTDLDYSPIAVDSAGRVQVVGSLTIGGTARDDTDDQAAVATGAGLQVVRNYGWDPVGSNWDRLRSRDDNTDNQSTATLGVPLAASRNFVFSAATGWNREREAHADTLTAGVPASGNMVYNGANWDRKRNPGVSGMQGVGGAEAHDAPVTGFPVLIAGRASQTLPTAVSADGDVSRIWNTLNGRQRTYPSGRRRSGIYHASLGPTTVTAAADGATVARWYFQNPVGSAVVAAVRKVYFSMTTGSGLLVLTAPTMVAQRFTFTGTASGATLTPGQRDSADAANVCTVRTAVTGMTVTAGAAMHGFQCPAALATTSAAPVGQSWPAGTDEDEWVIVRPGEGVMIRQSTAGTAADTRVCNFDLTWEEYLAADFAIRD